MGAFQYLRCLQRFLALLVGQVSDHLVGLGFGFDKGCSTLN